MNLELEAYEGELKMLRLYHSIIKHYVMPEELGMYFICGEAGAKDPNNMPEKIMVCPAYGVDFFYVYEYTGQTAGPEW